VKDEELKRAVDEVFKKYDLNYDSKLENV